MSPAKRWLWRGAALLWCAFIFYLSSQSTPPVPGFFDLIPQSDKIGHFFLYAVLGCLARKALAPDGRASSIRAWLPALILVSLYGASDEFHQHFVPGRTMDVFDWMADTLGAAAGIWAVIAAGRRGIRKRV